MEVFTFLVSFLIGKEVIEIKVVCCNAFPIQRKHNFILQLLHIYKFFENVTYAMYRDHKNLRGILECHNLRNLGW